ncbi:hypothetical protein B0H63DRAFT_447797 [Podospora didyma]|uniref:Uncharacterized protein n=1 Tax=Podospora didyma TaxID=330526 RepID=A0AAE0NSX8_9PEZI|nr:hypothetical protein B0H63DRAFT_447797 [Podospora didyma]
MNANEILEAERKYSIVGILQVGTAMEWFIDATKSITIAIMTFRVMWGPLPRHAGNKDFEGFDFYSALAALVIIGVLSPLKAVFAVGFAGAVNLVVDFAVASIRLTMSGFT